MRITCNNPHGGPFGLAFVNINGTLNLPAIPHKETNEPSLDKFLRKISPEKKPGYLFFGKNVDKEDSQNNTTVMVNKTKPLSPTTKEIEYDQ